LTLPKKKYEAGQFMVMDFIINNKKVSRAYSLSNDQEKDGYGRFIVKRVKNGVVSNFLLDNYENIKNIKLSGPFGDFIINKKTNNHVFIAGGSGITPIASILNSYLEKRKEDSFFLIYGNKNCQEIILDEEIFNLSKTFNNLKIVSFTNDGSSNFIQNKKGVLDYGVLLENINNFNLPFKDTTFYVCGPDGVINNCKKIFETLNIDESNIRIEKFISIQNIEKQTTNNKKFNLAVLEDNLVKKIIKISSNNTLLNNLIENNIDINYSCMSGICKMCKVSAEGNFKEKFPLSETDENGKKQILSCSTYLIEDSKIMIKKQ